MTEAELEKHWSHQFYIVFGDWSDDGHGKSDKILIETNIEMEDLQKAYKASVKKTGIGFYCNEKAKIKICDGYEENQMTETIYKALKKLNCPFDKMQFDGIGQAKISDENYENVYFDENALLNVLMWFISLSAPKLKWKQIKDKTPCFNGYWSKELNISIGYGLYS